MFGTENVIVQVRDPLLPGSGRVKVSHRWAKMHRDAIPKKAGYLSIRSAGDLYPSCRLIPISSNSHYNAFAFLA